MTVLSDPVKSAAVLTSLMKMHGWPSRDSGSDLPSCIDVACLLDVKNPSFMSENSQCVSNGLAGRPPESSLFFAINLATSVSKYWPWLWAAHALSPS